MRDLVGEDLMSKRSVRLVRIFLVATGVMLSASLLGPLEPTRSSSLLASESGDKHPGNDASQVKAAELLDVLGGTDLIRRLLDSTIEPMRDALPEIETSWWDHFLESADLGELVGRTVPIYAERLTADEMDALIHFYRSPHGQSILHKLPAITEDAMLVGQTWVLEEIQRMLRELEAEGHEIPPDLEI